MALPSTLIARWPDREFEIRRLFKSDEEFQTVALDLEEAMEALARWRRIAVETDPRVREFEAMVRDLEEEALRRLDHER